MRVILRIKLLLESVMNERECNMVYGTCKGLHDKNVLNC